MSLKSFHIFFIVVSVLTSVGLAAWCGLEYAGGAGAGMLALGVISLGIGVVLVVYGRAFKKKIADLPAARR